MVHWVKRLLIGHSACWPDELRALANLGFKSRSGRVFFQLNWPSEHATRLNSRTGTEGSPVPSLNCDRPLRSGIRAPESIMSMDCQITDSIRPCALHRSL